MPIRAVMVLILVLGVALASFATASGFTAGIMILLTPASLCGAALRLPDRRFLGFSVFGVGYLAMLSVAELPTTDALNAVYPYFQPRHAYGEGNIREALETPVPMNFPNLTPLEDVLKHVKESTNIPIYLDPIGLIRAEQNAASAIEIDLDGIPLHTSLALALSQLGLEYRVQGGLLYITDDSRPTAYTKIGHCWFALLAGAVGFLAGSRSHP